MVDKFTKKIKSWATKSISSARRVALINSVLMGIFNFWAKIFIIPQGVLKEMMTLCRNYLWGGDDHYKKAPYVAWEEVCKPKKYGGLGIKHMDAWNKASIAKLAWAIALQKDNLWVRWVHERHIKGKSWWDYFPYHDNCWYWKKVCKIKDVFK